MTIPNKVKIVEVGPRDGLQNEKRNIDHLAKIQLVNALSDAGLTVIETGSFVNPKWVPQMADSEKVFAGINRKKGVTYTALTPNLRGYEGAVAANADEVAVFAAASETFSQKNINCSIEESIERFKPVLENAKRDGKPVRGYVSCVVHCPYEGEISPQATISVCQSLLDLGCYEVSLGDTTGAGNPSSFAALLDAMAQQIDPSKLAIHCHDTYGLALANILVALQHGIAVFDSSIGGLGGCPYSPGASGNVATEDLIYMLHSMGIHTGTDLDKLIDAGQAICAVLEGDPATKSQSKAANAILSQH